MRFPIGSQYEPTMYLTWLLRYWASKILRSRPWPFGVTWRHQSHGRWIPDMQFRISHSWWDIKLHFCVLGSKIEGCNILQPLHAHVVWALNRHNRSTGLVTAVLQTNYLTALLWGPITCLCTGALITLATPLTLDKSQRHKIQVKIHKELSLVVEHTYQTFSQLTGLWLVKALQQIHN